MSLLDDLRRLFADAEVSLVGARDERVEAERALEARDWFRARQAARRLLDRAPHSPIGLALLADACEGAGLDAELEQTLAMLARVAGSSPDVWLRLGRVRARVGASSREIREALLRALAWTSDLDPEKRWSARLSRLMLADLELAEGNAVRAEGWLAPLDDGTDVRRRRIASAVSRRATAELARLLPGFEPDVGDAEGQRLLGDAHRLLGHASAAVRALARAAILEATGDRPSTHALDDLREAVAVATDLDEGALRAAETVAAELKVQDAPLWRAALSAARGEAKVAAAALREAIAGGAALASPADRAAARGLAIHARDLELLRRAPSSELADVDQAIEAALEAAARRDVEAATRALDALLQPATERVDEPTAGWLRELAASVARVLVPDASPAAWDALLERLGRHARALSDLSALQHLELLAAERARPVRIAIVGEFNAGKSTFVNALLGMDVAPTGILPTTAVPHVLRYGPDPIARARLRAGGARTVPPERLKSLLAELGDRAVTEVEVEVPFPYLQRVEIVDTPGFNAPDPEHARIAMETLAPNSARLSANSPSSASGVDVAVWLFDANQALKTSERRILEAIVARGIPVQALLNKADRLGPDDLARVIGTFVEDARSIGLASWRAPLAFSAKKGFQARTGGDEAALAASGFVPVRALMEDELPAHRDTLKERGLRRRARDLVEPLVKSAQAMHEQRASRLASRAAAFGALLAHAALLDRAAALDAGAAATREDRAADDLRRAVRDELRTALDAFRRERDELALRDHPSNAAYLERRLVEHVETAAGRAVATALAQEPNAPSPDEIALDTSAVARGFAAGGVDMIGDDGAAQERVHTPFGDVPLGRPVRPRVRGDLEGPLVRAVLTTVATRLRFLSQGGQGRAKPGDRVVWDDAATLPRVRELSAIEEVLARAPEAAHNEGGR